MKEGTAEFGRTAVSLARNPLGIIALFIVLVYGLACIVLISTRSLSESERIPLIYFIVIFPILVLASFIWLVSNHSGKLFSPSDFRNEENYIKMQLSAVASLAIAAQKDAPSNAGAEIQNIVKIVQSTAPSVNISSKSWKNHILWVDDIPSNNIYERRAFEAFGLQFTLAKSTNEALKKLKEQRFASIISDMGRAEGPREGYVLLDTLRKQGDQTPLFFYASSNAPEHRRETAEHGGQGCTNDAQELFQMVTKAVIVGAD